MKRFSNEITISYSTYCMELAAAMLHNQSAFMEEVAVSGESSSIQKSILHGWVGAGVWLDFILVGMVLVSVVGLAYTLLIH